MCNIWLCTHITETAAVQIAICEAVKKSGRTDVLPNQLGSVIVNSNQLMFLALQTTRHSGVMHPRVS